MYSEEVKAMLTKAGAGIGDYVKYSRGALTLEGIVLPRQESGDKNCLVLKLNSGYNAGVGMEKAKIEKIKSSKLKFKLPYHPKSSKTGPSSAPHLSLISTGGTIASRVDYETGAVHPQIKASELVGAYPRLKKFEPIKVNSLFSILSEDMNPSRWSEMAKEVKNEFDGGATGIVIAHGTDTMGYSSAALSYALQNLPSPLIFTGAQRSPDRASSDAAQNIFCSCAAARSNFAEVAICMHVSTNDTFNYIHWGTRARKSHTSGRWAFKSIGAHPIGKVDGESGNVQINDTRIPKKDLKRKIILKNKFSENVHLAWIYPGITPKTVSLWSKYDGIVIAGTGLGHAPLDIHNSKSKTSILPALKELISSDVIIAISPQTLGGRIMLETYSTGRKLEDIGVIGNRADWLPETCYAKLCWVLGQTKNKKKAEELMMAPVANDISPFSSVEESTYE
ncbi:MAG: Glu-tRNA(Gln) amidotransferase subunit GatD [Candidatus Micrarchaeota archaeon]